MGKQENVFVTDCIWSVALDARKCIPFGVGDARGESNKCGLGRAKGELMVFKTINSCEMCCNHSVLATYSPLHSYSSSYPWTGLRGLLGTGYTTPPIVSWNHQ